MFVNYFINLKNVKISRINLVETGIGRVKVGRYDTPRVERHGWCADTTFPIYTLCSPKVTVKEMVKKKFPTAPPPSHCARKLWCHRLALRSSVFRLRSWEESGYATSTLDVEKNCLPSELYCPSSDISKKPVAFP